MSILIDFLKHQLIDHLQQQYEEHAPEAREELISKASDLASDVSNWINSKVEQKFEEIETKDE